jgi:serine/threonine protein kinase
MPLSIGDTLGPHTRLARVGAGGMDEVYQARDTRLDRIVAIKVLPGTNGRQDQRERFQREARAISKLNHPNGSGVVLPASFERVVNRCLAKNPEDRWQSARDIAPELISIAERPPDAGAR